MTEAADFLRHGSDRHGDLMIVRRQCIEHLVEHRQVIFDQLSFRAALPRAPEWIESRSTQEFELRQETEGRQQPGAETHLARQSGRTVAPRQERWRQVKFVAKIVTL